MHIWHSHMKYIPAVAVGNSVVNHVTWCKIMQCLVFIFPLASRWMGASSLNCPNYIVRSIWPARVASKFPQVVTRRSLFYGEKLSRVKGSPSYPSCPGRANFPYIALQNLTNRLHEKQKAGSARRVTRLAGSPFFDINTLSRPARSTWSRR